MIDFAKLESRISEFSIQVEALKHLYAKAIKTVSDRRKIESLQSELSRIFSDERPDLIVNLHRAAKFLGVSARTLQHWTKAGMPKEAHGAYDLQAVFLWWRENIEGGRDSAKTEVLKQEKLRYQIEEIKLRVGQIKAHLLPDDEVFSAWGVRCRELWAMLRQLKDRLPPILFGKSIREMQELIEQDVKLINEAYLRDGRFCRLKGKEKPTGPRGRGRPRKK